MLVPEVYEIKLLPGVGYLSINLLGIEPGIEDKVNKRATAPKTKTQGIETRNKIRAVARPSRLCRLGLQVLYEYKKRSEI